MEVDIDNATISAGLLHDVKCSSLVAAFRAEDSKNETEKLQAKFKHHVLQALREYASLAL